MAFAPSKGKKHLKKEKGTLTLNSMMDMMTIILLFLLKSMSTSGALIKPSPYLELPFANREMEPKKALSILVTTDGVYEDMEHNPRVIADQAELEDPDNLVVPSLESYLLEQKEFSDKVGKQFTGEVTVQCDKEVTYDWLLKVINTCGQTEYSTIDFVILKAST